MKMKKLFNLFAIMLGVMMCFAFGQVQASELTSFFTGERITRDNVQKVADYPILLSAPITLQRRDSGYQYDGNKVIWEFVDKDNPKDMYYCLNKDQGFSNAYEAPYNYQNELNLDDLMRFSSNTWNQEKYNKIIWILDNIYVPKESITDIYSDASFVSLLQRAGIDTKKRNDVFDLTVKDVVIAQRLAVWNITNDLDVISSISGMPDYDRIDSETGDKILSRKSKTIKLYDYLVNNASETYTRKGEPKLTLGENDVIIKDNIDHYLLGPFSLSGDNIENIKEIQANVNKSYTLLEESGKKVENNDFTKVIGKRFYLKVMKNDITASTEIELNLTYQYSNRNFTFMTNSTDSTNTQPVVIVNEEDDQKEIQVIIPIELVEVEVEKIWEDNNNQDGVRPENIKVQLYQDGIAIGNSIILSNSNDWSYKWERLLSGYEYTIKELNSNNVVVENNEKYNNDYTTSYTIQNNKTILTNTHIPETIEKTVVKIWEDGNNQDNIRPNSIKVTLYKTVNEIKQKVEEKELNESNEWKYTWTNLDKYENGEEIVYTVEESVPNHYTVEYSTDTFTITNKYTPGTVSKTIIKEWDDQDNVDGIRPESITVQLYANGEKYGEEVVLNKENGFTHTWTSLPEKENGIAIDYTVSEIKIGEENVVNNSAAGYDVEYKIEGNVIIVTNKHVPEKTSKTVVKIWNDKDNKSNIRPNAITVQLYANGERYGEPVTLTSGSDKIWQTEELSYTWTELPLKKDGEEITYTVKELNVDEAPIENGERYDGKYITTYSEDTFEITNTYQQFDLALRKFVTQVNDQIYSREPIVDTSTIASTGTATYKHIKQPIAVQKGDIVTYTIRVYNEGELDGYVDRITDHLPDNLLPMIEGIEGIDAEKYKEEIEFNSKYSWIYTDKGNTVTTMADSKANSDIYGLMTGNEEITDTKLDAYVEGSDKLDYIDVQIKCLVTDKVTSGEYLTNIAEITEAQDINGIQGDGIDSELGNVDYSNLADYKNQEAIESTTDSYVPGQEDDDDFEKLVVKEFDLSLRKFISKVNETSYSREPKVDTSKLGTVDENGKTITTAIYTHSKEPVIVETEDIVTYKIRIYNEGTIAGFANEITDNIPKGLEFLPNSSVNVSYKWKMLDSEGNETDDVTKAVVIVTDYLSNADKNNIIEAVTEKDGEKILSYKDVEVQFKVIAKAEKGKNNTIINEAQISADSDRDIDSTPNRDEEYNYNGENEDDIDYAPIKLQYFDLALRKFITKVNTTDYNNRYPEIIYNEDNSITYKHSKDPVLVATNDVIIYTIRVYNEGEKAGYATEIIDNLPEGLEFLPENEINQKYDWKLIDSEGNVTEDITKAVKVATDNLKDEMINAFVEENGQKVLSYQDVQIAFKVTESNLSSKILVNTAEISKDSDDDIDSTPGNNEPSEDDIDKEYVQVQYFDLSLKKWVTESRVTYNGKTTITKTNFSEDTDEIAKVDLVASKMNKTTVKFAYNIKVTNEGELPGYAYEVKDYIPKGLKFIQEDNKDWKEVKDGVVVTDKLKDTLLNPGESATVEIVLTWKNSTTNTGLKTNYAEISKDSGDDIDSTPDNFNLKEDDIDDAQVILSIKTAGAPTYVGLVLLSVAILAGGIFLIKKYVIK